MNTYAKYIRKKFFSYLAKRTNKQNTCADESKKSTRKMNRKFKVMSPQSFHETKTTNQT